MTDEEAVRSVAYEALVAAAEEFGFLPDNVKDLLFVAAEGIILDKDEVWP